MERIALFAGSFDPYTRGHHSIVKRALPLFDKIIIAIGENFGKQSYMVPQEREKQIKALYEGNSKIEVCIYNTLTMDFAKNCNATCLIRGIRDVGDFEYERKIADINREVGGIETLFLVTEPELSLISSSTMRELNYYGKDISQFLPKKENI